MRPGTAIAWIAATGMALAGCAAQAQALKPGHRVLLDAHNCYPYWGLWADRIDRALAAGAPLSIELDLMWRTDPGSGAGEAVLSHGPPVTGSEPTLRAHFFDRVRPLVERALAEDDRTQWPLLVLNINDMRGDARSLRGAVWDILGDHETWLCTAPKTSRITEVAPIKPGPVLVLVSGGEDVFYDAVPEGGLLRAFGSARTRSVTGVSLPSPEALLDRPATNFHRWWNNDWSMIEEGGQIHAGEWSAEDEERLNAFVAHGHRLGYWVRFYTLNGHPRNTGPGLGLNPEYNFGSAEAAHERWRAAMRAGVDLVATDQYEDFARFIRSGAASQP